MQQYGMINNCVLKSFFLYLNMATSGDNFLLVSKPDGSGGANILADDPITADNLELVYSSRDIDFNLILTVHGQSVSLATDKKPSSDGFYIYKLSYKNISFLINIVITTTYTPKYQQVYRELGFQVMDELRTSASSNGNSYIRLIIDE